MSASALLDAAASDSRRAAGKPIRPFEGVRIAIKDSMDIREMATKPGELQSYTTADDLAAALNDASKYSTAVE